MLLLTKSQQQCSCLSIVRGLTHSWLRLPTLSSSSSTHPSFRELNLVITVVTENHRLKMVINRMINQERDLLALLGELSDPVVTVVGQDHREENHRVSREDVIVTRGLQANMEDVIHAAQGVKIGTCRLGPRLLIPVTIKTTVAGLDIPHPTKIPVSGAEAPTIRMIVGYTDITMAIRVRNVEKCTRLQPTGHAVLLISEPVGLTE